MLSADKPSLGSDLVSWLQISTPHLLEGSIHEGGSMEQLTAPGTAGRRMEVLWWGKHVLMLMASTPALSQVLYEPGLSQALDFPSFCHLLLQP